MRLLISLGYNLALKPGEKLKVKTLDHAIIAFDAGISYSFGERPKGDIPFVDLTGGED